MNIPTTNFQAVVKQVPVVDLDPEDRTVLDLCFPEFLQEGDRMADYEDLGIAQLYTAYQSRPVHWGRLRRYAGSPELGPGRYYALCTREDGFDGGTLMNELMTYWSDATMVWPGLTDSTHLPPEERAQHAELDAPKLCIHVTRYGPRRRFLRSTTIEKLDEFVHLLPLPVRRVEIKNVLDLRIPEAQTWFFEYFVRLEEKIGLEGHVLDQSPDVRVSTFKYHKPGTSSISWPPWWCPASEGAYSIRRSVPGFGVMTWPDWCLRPLGAMRRGSFPRRARRKRSRAA